MECDSMHSRIEQKLKGEKINVPGDYVTICEKARKRDPGPYKVQYLDHTFFKDCSIYNPHSSIRPGKLPTDPKLIDLKCLKYNGNKDESIQFKTDFKSETYEVLQVRPRRKTSLSEKVDYNMEFPKLYKDRLKIKRSKFNHLQEMKCVLPVDYHSFYDNVPHE